jgi:hypothetical protein
VSVRQSRSLLPAEHPYLLTSPGHTSPATGDIVPNHGLHGAFCAFTAPGERFILASHLMPSHLVRSPFAEARSLHSGGRVGVLHQARYEGFASPDIHHSRALRHESPIRHLGRSGTVEASRRLPHFICLHSLPLPGSATYPPSSGPSDLSHSTLCLGTSLPTLRDPFTFCTSFLSCRRLHGPFSPFSVLEFRRRR